MASNKTADSKGDDAEELLRDYFLQLQYFVVRGVPFRYENEDVTDVDLWLYHRHSPISRERINVDIKNKKTPQAIERILWARGLQVTLGLDRCIVATTDSRPSVVNFGRDHGVLVLDGNFFSSLKARGRDNSRLTESEFLNLFDVDNLGKLGGNWKERVEFASGRLLTHLGYDGCNGWLDDLRFFLTQTQTHTQRVEAAMRSTYLLISYFLIGLDFAVSRIVFEPLSSKITAISEGLLHGSDGRERTEKMLAYASKVAAYYGASNASHVKKEMENAMGQLPVGIISEHFSKGTNLNMLFAQARTFEALAFSRTMLWPGDLSTECKSVLGVLIDFLAFERAKIFNLGSTKALPRASNAAESEPPDVNSSHP